VTGAVKGDVFTESFTTTALLTSNVGTYAIVPSIVGTNLSDYTVITDNGVLTVTQAASATVLSSSNQNANLNASVTFTVTVTSTTTGTPTGTIGFLDGTTVLGTSSLNAQGVATYTTSALTAGTRTINAVYGGDQNFDGSSAMLSQQVTAPAYSIIANPQSLTLAPRQTALVNVAFTPVGGYTGTVTFRCAGLPEWSACIFAPSTLTADGTNMPLMTQMIIKTVGSNDGTVKPGQVQPTPLASAGLWFLPAGVLGGLLWWRRRQLSAAAKQMLMTLVMMAGAMGVIGCVYPVPHVPVGSPTVTITATGANGVSQSTTVTLIITQ